ncbi:hypothetical protein G7Y89_g4120 [Cudoniella acicularis]|uniref:Uncharacterized protein n=1 Tax=Cudoniella acicularis TaxID=354080 RepID=A0A8H4W4K7_9HELO|nr:hypothetical protein G7Y89_g4120 [Cudoniella acicularis]
MDSLSYESAIGDIERMLRKSATPQKLIDTVLKLTPRRITVMPQKPNLRSARGNPSAEEFERIIRDSRLRVLGVAAHYKYFESSILPMASSKTFPKANKLTKRDQFIEDIRNGPQRPLMRMPDTFTALITNMDAFIESLQTWASQKPNKATRELNTFGENLQKLQQEMEYIKLFIITPGIVGGIAGVGTSIGLASLIGPPALFAGLTKAGVPEMTLVNLGVTLSGKRKAVDEVDTPITRSSKTRQKIATVWKWLQNDAVRIRDKLQHEQTIPSNGSGSGSDVVLQEIGSFSGTCYLESYSRGS